MNTVATAVPPAIPRFLVDVSAPDLDPWREGNTGVRGFTTRDSGVAGPHVVLTSLMHGNEIAGAIALDRLLRGDLQPLRGKLTFGFANVAAFDRFDPAEPIASRYVEEDLNRVWDRTWLGGSRRSVELDRARDMRPLIDTADVLLDLHSMLWPSDPLILCGSTVKGRRIAQGIGTPALVVSDPGHSNGRRLIDYAPFADHELAPVAILVEAGQHWEAATVEATIQAIAGMLRLLGMVAPDDPILPPRAGRMPAAFAEVTTVVTAKTAGFAFVQSYRGGQIIRKRDTLLAVDGVTDIRTPYNNCLLVMPSLRPSRGHTAVRLARVM
jgi:predicted deacylase